MRTGKDRNTGMGCIRTVVEAGVMVEVVQGCIEMDITTPTNGMDLVIVEPPNRWALVLVATTRLSNNCNNSSSNNDGRMNNTNSIMISVALLTILVHVVAVA